MEQEQVQQVQNRHLLDQQRQQQMTVHQLKVQKRHKYLHQLDHGHLQLEVYFIKKQQQKKKKRKLAIYLINQ